MTDLFKVVTELRNMDLQDISINYRMNGKNWENIQIGVDVVKKFGKPRGFSKSVFIYNHFGKTTGKSSGTADGRPIFESKEVTFTTEQDIIEYIIKESNRWFND